MTNEELWTSGWPVALVLAIVLVVVTIANYMGEHHTNAALDYERKRNERLVTRVMNLQSLVRVQDHIIVAKIDVILDEHERTKPAPPAAEGDLFSTDAVISTMDYCYTCQGLRRPSHFDDPAHRKSPAPDLVGP